MRALWAVWPVEVRALSGALEIRGRPLSGGESRTKLTARPAARRREPD